VYSLIIPVYKNEESLPDLLKALDEMSVNLGGRLEVVFVVDGSPDRCYPILRERLSIANFASKLLLLSRNFGSFPAIRAGLAAATGPFFAVMAADLQEPPELAETFFRTLESEPLDIIIGTRSQRADPLLSRIASGLYWRLYRKFIQREIPPGGVDVFGCNKAFRDWLLTLNESNTSLVGLLFWLGFRRKIISYERRAREHGKSAWTFHRKWRYLMDSAFAFSDLPIRVLVFFGSTGLVFSTLFSVLVLLAKSTGLIEVPGYAATVLLISFFAALNSFGLGIIGSYVWRAFENTKGRPQSIVMLSSEFKQGEK
jgi:glycosyltransferase involved in cell wall biosynthesis